MLHINSSKMTPETLLQQLIKVANKKIQIMYKTLSGLNKLSTVILIYKIFNRQYIP